MTMNSSGPISLAGTTAGQSIEIELGGGGTTMISLNDTNVRTLAGVPSGAIIMPTNFWGKSNASAFVSFLTNGYYSNANTSGLDFDTSGNIIYSTYSLPSYYPATELFVSTSPTGSLNSQNYITTRNNTYIYNTSSPYGTVIDSSNNYYLFGVGGSQRPTFTKTSLSGTVSISTFFNTYSTAFFRNASYDSTSNKIYVGVNDTGSLISNRPRGGYFIFPLSTYTGTQSITVNYVGGSLSGSNFDNTGIGISTISYISSTPYITVCVNWNSGGAGPGFTTFNASTNAQVAQYKLSGISTFSWGLKYSWDSNGYLYLCGSAGPAGAGSFWIGQNSQGTSSSFGWQKLLTSASVNGSTTTLSYASTATDSSNNVYMLGQIYDSASQQIYIAIIKYNSSGTLQWQRTLSFFNPSYGLLYNNANSILIDSSAGYFYIAGGIYQQNVNTGASTYTYLIKLPLDGSLTGIYSPSGSIYAMYSYGNLSESTPSGALTSYTSVSSATSTYASNANGWTFYTSTSSLVSSSTTITSSTSGSATYSEAGTYSWICPAGVTSVSVVAIGGGGSGYSVVPYNTGGGGGGGGGLGYKNNYSVTPGNSYTVVVGYGGLGPTGGTNGSQAGTDSYFVSTSVVKGGGGSGGASYSGGNASGGTYTGDGGGNGGLGGGDTSGNVGGGGGAGGYSGSGGNGGNTASGGSGGGAGGGGQGLGYSQGGGGVYILGQGSNGSAGGTNNPGTGGSGGSPGNVPPIISGQGGFFGGGGGGGYNYPGCCCNPAYTLYGANGANGAVRIIWPGSSRSFPSTNAGTP